jgi:hypothetical protein
MTSTTAGPTEVAELAGRILDAIEANPGAFDMDAWYRNPARAELLPDAEPACGTTMCIAGWAAHLTGWTLGRYSRASKGGVGRFIENVAADALGFTESDSSTVSLFHMPAYKALAELRAMAGR